MQPEQVGSLRKQVGIRSLRISEKQKALWKRILPKQIKKVIWSIKIYHAEYCSQPVHLHSWWKSSKPVFVLQKILGVSLQAPLHREVCGRKPRCLCKNEHTTELPHVKGSVSWGLILSMQKLDSKYLENPHLPGPPTAGKCQLAPVHAAAGLTFTAHDLRVRSSIWII